MTLQDWLTDTGREAARVPAHWIVFGGNWDGDQFALDLSVSGGEVVWFDHELLPAEPDDPFPPQDGMARLGQNFAGFVDGLLADLSDDPPPPPAPRWWQRLFGG